MNDSEFNKSAANSMKFLFCFKTDTAEKSLCGCNIRKGTQIITGVYLFCLLTTMIVDSIVIDIHRYGGCTGWVFSLIISLLQMIGPVMLLISTFTNHFKLAYIGNAFLTIFLLIGAIMVIILPIAQRFHAGLFFLYLFLYGSLHALIIYFSFIIFSFVKELGLENFSKIDGSSPGLTSNYQNVDNSQNEHTVVYVLDINAIYGQSDANQSIPTSTSGKVQSDYKPPSAYNKV